MLRMTHLTLLLALVAPVIAQDAPPPQDTGESGTVTAQDGEGKQQTKDTEAKDEQPAAAVEPADTFQPTEQVDEDYSVAFPTDI